MIIDNKKIKFYFFLKNININTSDKILDFELEMKKVLKEYHCDFFVTTNPAKDYNFDLKNTRSI
ncbi:hypothetical protein UF09_45 [Marinitoga camini virus 2]|nr:hypothetical protein UF09_45 [Marinitoga camini virus 2]